MAEMIEYHVHQYQDSNTKWPTFYQHQDSNITDSKLAISTCPKSSSALTHRVDLTTLDTSSATFVFRHPATFKAWATSLPPQSSTGIFQHITIRLLPPDLKHLTEEEQYGQFYSGSNILQLLQAWRTAFKDLRAEHAPTWLNFDLSFHTTLVLSPEMGRWIQLFSTVLAVRTNRGIRFTVSGCSDREKEVLGAGLGNLFEPGSEPPRVRSPASWANLAKGVERFSGATVKNGKHNALDAEDAVVMAGTMRQHKEWGNLPQNESEVVAYLALGCLTQNWTVSPVERDAEEEARRLSEFYRRHGERLAHLGFGAYVPSQEE